MNGTRTGIHRIALLLVLAACGSRTVVPGERTDRNVISQEEMLAAGSSDAYSIVQSLRPQWLSTRGVSTINLRESVKVYLDGSLLGGPEHLQRITVHAISSIRYMDSIEATQRWGLDHGLGAILVSTRREGRRSERRLSPQAQRLPRQVTPRRARTGRHAVVSIPGSAEGAGSSRRSRSAGSGTAAAPAGP